MRNQRARKSEKKSSIKIIIPIIILVIIIAGIVLVLNTIIFKGKYNKNNVMITEEVKLNILKETLTKIDFEIETNKTSIKGTANKEKMNVAKYKKDGVELVFKRNLKDINLKFNGDYTKVGIYSSINLDGEYIKGKPVYKEQNRFTKIFYTEKMQKDLKDLLKEDFKELEDIAIDGACIEDMDYEMNAKVYKISKTGINKKAIVLTDSKEYFYIGYFNGEKIVYLTNNDEYKNNIPGEIKKYASINKYIF